MLFKILFCFQTCELLEISTLQDKRKNTLYWTLLLITSEHWLSFSCFHHMWCQNSGAWCLPCVVARLDAINCSDLCVMKLRCLIWWRVVNQMKEISSQDCGSGSIFVLPALFLRKLEELIQMTCGEGLNVAGTKLTILIRQRVGEFMPSISFLLANLCQLQTCVAELLQC